MSKIINKIKSIDAESNVKAPGFIELGDSNRIDNDKTSDKTDPIKSEERHRAERRPSKKKQTEQAPKSYTGTMIIIGLLWIICSLIIAYSVLDFGYKGQPLTAFQWAGFALFVLAPFCLILITFNTFSKLSHISVQSSRLEQAVQEILSPDDTTVSRAAIMSEKIKAEINHVNQEVDLAISRMDTLKNTLDEQVKSINQSSYSAENKSQQIATRLSEERQALTDISTSFETRMSGLSELFDLHDKRFEEGILNAEQKIQEAKIGIESVAEKINLTSDSVRQNTVEATTSLNDNHGELNRLGDELKTRALELDAIYQKHSSDLTRLVESLKTEQDNLGTLFEQRLEKMRDMSLSAQVSARNLTDASSAGRETIEALADASRLSDQAIKLRFKELEELVNFSNARAENISEKAMKKVQDSLAQSRKEIARIEYDMVTLQTRLEPSEEPTSNSQEPTQPSQSSNADISSKPAKRGIRLQPVLDETTEFEDMDEPSTASLTETSALKGLRPAPETDETFTPTTIKEVSLDKFLEGGDQIGTNLTLSVGEPSEEDIIKPDPDIELKTYKPEILSTDAHKDDDMLVRPVPFHEKPSKKTYESSGGWLSRMFSGKSKKTDSFAIDQLTSNIHARAPNAPPDMPSNPAPTYSDNPPENFMAKDMIQSLGDVGLSPHAIVDDGTILEAVMTRMGRGPLIMSKVVTRRLSKPIAHLTDLLTKNPHMRTQAIQFARNFHESLGPIENDRQALQNRFEGESGRAFLLCDAALNL